MVYVVGDQKNRFHDTIILHKTTFGEPLGVPVIKPTQILKQPGGTGLYPGKPHSFFLLF